MDSLTDISRASARSRDGADGVLADLFRRLDRCEGEEEAQEVTGALVRALGFAYFSYGVPNLAGDWVRPDDKGMLLTTYPAGWQSLYRRRSYHAEDAVILHGREALRPFIWGDAAHLRSLKPSARRLFLEARQHGIGSGIAIPVHGPHNMNGLFSVSGPEAERPGADVGEPGFRTLLAAAHIVHARVLQWRAREPRRSTIKLSEHERLCLHWTTQGKTAWEVAQIIGRSKATVDFHLRRASAKLDAANKVHAAFKARELDLL
jgi:LuxR family transcriptional regulator, activator of conjugal transfer of Ti plasmids